MIISRTPLRISFAGGGTDLPSFYKNNEYGAVVSTSINSFIYVTIKKHSELFPEKYRLNYSITEQVDKIDEINNPIIRECIRFLEIDDRLYISTIADCPGSSGLGSSSTFCVGLLNALYKYKGINASAGRLADEAAYIEITMLNRPIGKQDHYAAAFGGLNYIRFEKNETVTIKPITSNLRNIESIFSSLLSFWTGVTRPAESILKEQDDNNKINSEILIEMREQANELSLLIDSDRFSTSKFGELLHKGWILKQTLASKISNSEINKAYSIARDAGSLGGKISGAGGGGFLNLIALKENHLEIIQKLQTIGLVNYKFNIDSNGTQVNVIN